MTYTSLGKHLISGGVCLAFLGMPGVMLQAPVQAAPQISAVEKAEVKRLLLVLTTDRNQYVRARAATELGMIADPSALEQLHTSLVKDLSTQVRMNSASAIARVNQKSSAKRLLQALLANRGRTDAQIAIIRALGDMRGNSRDLVPALLQLLRSPSPFIREAAVEALWKIGDKKVSKYLVKLLKTEEDTMVKMTLCSTIADYKDPNSIPVLEKISKQADQPVDIRALAQEALDKLSEMGVEAP
jgi:HEAT repeat protein